MDIAYERQIQLTMLVIRIEEGTSEGDILRIVNKEIKNLEERCFVFRQAYMQCWPENNVDPKTKKWDGYRDTKPKYAAWKRHKALVIGAELECDLASEEVLWVFGSAIKFGDEEMVQVCLSRGISPNIALDEDGNTAMHLAVFVSQEFVEMILGAGGTFSALNKKHETPLSRLIKATNNHGAVLGEHSFLYRFNNADRGLWLRTACWIADQLVNQPGG